ncbi:arabinan endo-1,5-alpha-L-arabinosidase [Kribbella italica]|uniref:Arabinan endo-1,5-alpha-L-arabinosidase n=1 Tax=Kribbella italica TaxID=1540520 RepID=A0A7W9JE47_9ACTN|nr:arabinan endo-1,5-alpha-L-arabinosidase [Kribbella italica]MBB5840117.1 arabinan endo-1,5-alpha-L-arabinosidase [Kribbella italica]
MRRLCALLCALTLAVPGAVPAAARTEAGASVVSSGSDVPVLSGDLRTHDPALIRDGSQWYVFSTGDPAVAGGSVQLRRSSDGRHWTSAGTVFGAIPDWIRAEVPGVENLWAPEVIEHDGTFYLYYSASAFGSNRSLIALATNTTLDPGDPGYRWVDRGVVHRSAPSDDYNAIDPGVVVDGNGVPWMAFGSFWSGIRMIRLQWPSGLGVPGQGAPLRLADRRTPPNAVEAPYVVRRGGWYYLFVSFDLCCRGAESTYKIAVGRSRSVTGPYADQLGKPMLEGGGTILLSGSGTMAGPGGQSVNGDWLAHHYYDTQADGDFRLGLRSIRWDSDGWPHVT